MGAHNGRWSMVVLGVLTSAGAARAETHGCEDVRIHVDGAISPRWSDAIARACSELAGVKGTDASARVRITPDDEGVTIAVTLADGRSASRRLQSPDHLRSTLEALLALPPTSIAAAPVRATEATTAPLADTGWPPADEPWPSAKSTAERSLGIDAGGALGGRVAAQGYVSFAPSGFAELRVGPWLFGGLFRWEAIGKKSAPLVDTFEMTSLAAALFVGRRVPLGFLAIDVGISPRIVVDSQTWETSTGEHDVSSTDIRLGSLGRLLLGRGAVRGLVELDAEISPARLRREVKLDPLLPPLPSWNAGLSAGLLWASAP